MEPKYSGLSVEVFLAISDGISCINSIKVTEATGVKAQCF